MPAMDNDNGLRDIVCQRLTAWPAREDTMDGVLLCHALTIMTDLVIRQGNHFGD